MNLYRTFHVTRLVCFLGALVALVRTNAQDWETIFTQDMPGYNFTPAYRGFCLDPSDKWAAQRLFVGALAIPSQEDVDPYPPAKLFMIDLNTGTHQEAAGFPITRNTRALGFSPKSGALLVNIDSAGDADEWPGGLFSSFDRGASWSRLGASLGGWTPVTFDNEGTLFKGGAIMDQGRWLPAIQKSPDDGQTWTAIYVTDQIHQWQALHFVDGPAGGLFVGGTGSSPSYGGIVRRSRDSGTTWTTVLTTGNQLGFDKITSDPQGGRIYVAADIYDAPIRLSTNGGDTWQIIPLPVTSFAVNDMVADAVGNLYVSGYSGGTSATSISSVYRRSPEGKWEDLGTTVGSQRRFGNLALDPAGNLYATGSYGSYPRTGALVMRLALDPVALPPLEIASSGGALTVSWPTVEGAHLESTAVLGNESNWVRVSQAVVMEGTRTAVKLTPEEMTTFFRLFRP
jgi:hypothetical protein